MFHDSLVTGAFQASAVLCVGQVCSGSVGPTPIRVLWSLGHDQCAVGYRKSHQQGDNDTADSAQGCLRSQDSQSCRRLGQARGYHFMPRVT